MICRLQILIQKHILKLRPKTRRRCHCPRARRLFYLNLTRKEKRYCGILHFVVSYPTARISNTKICWLMRRFQLKNETIFKLLSACRILINLLILIVLGTIQRRHTYFTWRQSKKGRLFLVEGTQFDKRGVQKTN